MLIRIYGIIIMIYMIFWGYHIRNNQTKKIGSGTFAVCKNHGTRQRCQSLPCAKTMAHSKGTNLCHVQKPRHTVKIKTLPCATSAGHTAKSCTTSPFLSLPLFLPWVGICTRQRLCCVPDIKHTAKAGFADAWLPCAAHGKGFAVCHSRPTPK